MISDKSLKVLKVFTTFKSCNFAKVSKNSQQNNLETVKMSMIKKYLKKDVYLQKKGKKLLMI